MTELDMTAGTETDGMADELSDEALDRPGDEYKFLCSSGPTKSSPPGGA